MTKKLTKRDLDLLQATLLRARAVLTGDVQHLHEETLGSTAENRTAGGLGEEGADTYFQEFNIELLARDKKTLREINEALERIETGEFGRCEICENWIRRERLKAVPHARNCIDCQRQAEKGGG